MTLASSTRTLFLLSSLLLASLSLASPQPRPRATVCNGDASLCSRSYGNVTFLGTHNSYAIGSSIAANQGSSIAQQLDAGVRMLQVQAHKSDNTSTTGAGIDLCHTSCSLYQGGALESYLGEVKSWMDSNPTDIVTLLIVNSDGLSPSQFAQAYQSSGLDTRSYKPAQASTPKSNWPTLGSMLDAGTSLVTFMTPDADTSTVGYIIDEFSNAWENPYDQTTFPFNCSVDRIDSSVSSSDVLFISNHFLDESIFGSSTALVPAKDNLTTTNSISNVQNGCQDANFILVDFVEVGQAPQAVAALNGVSYTGKPFSGSSSGSSGNSGNTATAFPIPLLLIAATAPLVGTILSLS